MSHRIRLDEDERVYLIDLINENTKLQGALISLPIRKLLRKLGDDSKKPDMARKIPKRLFRCNEDGCNRVIKSGAGLNRHTTIAHYRTPTENEKQDILL